MYTSHISFCSRYILTLTQGTWDYARRLNTPCFTSHPILADSVKTQDWARICCACLTARSVTSDLLTLFLSHVYHTIPIPWISHHAYYINTLSRLSHNTYLHEKQCVVHTHTHTHTYTYTHTHKHKLIYTYTQTHTHLYTRIFCMLLNRRSWRSLEL